MKTNNAGKTAKKSYSPSKDKTLSFDCNSFDAGYWKSFRKAYPKLEFVDVDQSVDKYWKNTDDTAVFLINTRNINPVKFAQDITELRVDEYLYQQVSQDTYLVRLWWD